MPAFLLAVLAAIVAWFYWFGRKQTKQRVSEIEDAARRATEARMRAKEPARQAKPAAEDLRECPVCHAFRPASQTHCATPGCAGG